MAHNYPNYRNQHTRRPLPPPAYSAEPPPIAPSTTFQPVGQYRNFPPESSTVSQPTRPTLVQLNSDASLAQLSIASSSSSGLDGLNESDTVLLIDDSFSMNSDILTENGDRSTRWKVLESILDEILPKCIEHDDDGPDIYFMNAKNHATYVQIGEKGWPEGGGWVNIKDMRKFKEAMAMGKRSLSSKTSKTPIGGSLKRIITPYMRKIPAYNQSFRHRVFNINRGNERLTVSRPKPLNIIVITDGEPYEISQGKKDSQKERKYIIDYLNRIGRIQKADNGRRQIGIFFIQIGAEKDATDFMTYLDDNLKGLDFVDTHRWAHTAALKRVLQKVLLGALNPELDQMRINAQGRFGG